jgi:hypothetical protein
VTIDGDPGDARDVGEPAQMASVVGLIDGIIGIEGKYVAGMTPENFNGWSIERLPLLVPFCGSPAMRGLR